MKCLAANRNAFQPIQKFFLIVAVLCLTTSKSNAQGEVEIAIPEAYELSNIILALTEYGKADQWEVNKNSTYYNEVIKFFEPVKDHPILKKVNYSRDLWKDYLSFRTDAVAYKFNSSNKLIRINNFYTNNGFKPFDSSLSLINDFIQQSKFRQFYSSHKSYYSSIVQQYDSYYMIKETRAFLQKLSGADIQKKRNSKYEIILSPLVGRMNCHRNIDSNTIADFPSLSPALINGNRSEISNQAERAVEIHTLFTEMDHGYVNPITDKYAELVRKKFDNKYWDIKSGYKDLNCFNEYMTWAVYDLFTQKYFPQYADSINTQWHYQNASRGFYASNLFAKQFSNAFHESKDKKLSSIYSILLKWTAGNQNKNELPKINVERPQDTLFALTGTKIVISFSKNMDTTLRQISFIISKIENNRNKGREVFTITKKHFKWIDTKTLQIENQVNYDAFSMIFNWWGCKYPLMGENKIFLSPYSFINFKK